MRMMRTTMTTMTMKRSTIVMRRRASQSSVRTRRRRWTCSRPSRKRRLVQSDLTSMIQALPTRVQDTLRVQAAAFMGVAKDSTRSPEDVVSTPLPGETLAMFYARSRMLPRFTHCIVSIHRTHSRGVLGAESVRNYQQR